MQPKDGKHSKSRLTLAHFRNGCIAPRRYSAVVAIVFVACTLAESPAYSRDRPRLFSRPIVPAVRQASSTAPSGSVVNERIADGPQDSPEKTSIPSGTSIDPPSQNVTPSNNLRRFPQKSATSAASPDDEVIPSDERVTPIDLPSALKLAGWTSPEVLVAQQRVLAVTARQQLAAAQALPSLNIGTNYDQHSGAVQRASGAILQIQRSSLYAGAGANAVAAGSVNLPGLTYNLNVGEAYFNYLISRQQTERSRAAAAAVQNNTLLLVANAYCELVRQQGARAVAIRSREDAAEIVRITSAFAAAGQGRDADAKRAQTEFEQRNADVFQTDAAIVEASARLVEILNLDSSIRLQSSENWIVPRSVVPDLIPLPELIAIAMYQRPEMAERRAEVHSAMLELKNAQLLLFSPQFIAGLSGGIFGGGGDVNAQATGKPRFGDFASRNDQDLILYWSIRNLGLANKALIKTATARLAATDWERTRQLNDIRAQVAQAYARTQSRAAQLDVRSRAVATSERGFREDLQRARAGEGHPIEVLDSLRLRAKSQQEYLDTIADYNQAQYALYVAIGQPQADLLIHSNPASELPSPAEEGK